MVTDRTTGEASRQTIMPFPSTTTKHTPSTTSSFSPLLHLPLELRLNIYTYLLVPSKSLTIDHCTHLSIARLPTPRNQPRPSPLSRYLTSRRLLTQWCRSHGLHLPQVCRQLRDEMFLIMKRQNVRIEGHCVECLGRIMGCLRESGLVSTGQMKLKEWWVRVSCGAFMLGAWESNSVFTGMETLKAVVERRFGGAGLVTAAALRRPNSRSGGGASGGETDDDCRFWYCEGVGDVKRDREFVVEYVRITGRQQKSRKRKRRNRSLGGTDENDNDNNDNDDEMELDIGDDGIHELNQDDEDENDDEEDDEDEDEDGDDNSLNNDPNAPFVWDLAERYTYDSSVIETERRVKRYYFDRPEDQRRIANQEGFSNAYMKEGDAQGWWRESATLNRQYGKGKAWVVREEIWIGCSFL